MEEDTCKNFGYEKITDLHKKTNSSREMQNLEDQSDFEEKSKNVEESLKEAKIH